MKTSVESASRSSTAPVSRRRPSSTMSTKRGVAAEKTVTPASSARTARLYAPRLDRAHGADHARPGGCAWP